jgi:hypothetical protein
MIRNPLPKIEARGVVVALMSELDCAIRRLLFARPVRRKETIARASAEAKRKERVGDGFLKSIVAQKILGNTGLDIATRILGLFLAAMGVQVMIDGLAPITVGSIKPVVGS